jgi:hypothetical protein
MLSVWFTAPADPRSSWPPADPDNGLNQNAAPDQHATPRRAITAGRAATNGSSLPLAARPPAAGPPAAGPPAAHGKAGAEPGSRGAARPGVAPAEPTAATVNGAATLDNGRWRSAADDGWQAARALAGAAPSEYTTAGLPKRSPRQSLLPGSVAAPSQDPASAAKPAVTERDAAELRGRLSSLRDGLNRGRHQLHGTKANGAAPAPEQSA